MYPNFSPCGFAGLRQMKEKLMLKLTVCFTLKLIFLVHHFRDVQNRVKDNFFFKKVANNI